LATATTEATPLELVLAVMLVVDELLPAYSVVLAPLPAAFTVNVTAALETALLLESVTVTSSAAPNCTPMFAV
jgi:hypothetical protein